MDNGFFIKNRKKLVNSLEDNSIMLLFAGDAPYKSADEKYKFTPNRNFYYLTGIDRNKIIVLITKIKGNIIEKVFVERPDPVMAKWVGETMSEDEAKEASGIEAVSYLDKFEDYLSSLMSRNKIDNLYLDLERQELNSSVTESQYYAKELVSKYPYIRVQNIFHEIAALRLIKSEEEIELIKEAIRITGNGIENMMKHSKPDMMEYELEAYFDYTLKSEGVTSFAFPTIVASGKNATILHYGNNNCRVEDGNLVLLDLGAQWKYYNGDITRTFPVNGKFTERQKEIYNIVLKAQKSVEEAVKPGIPFAKLNEIAKEVLAEGCIELGLIKEKSEVSKYYFHGVAHYMGLDTHDVGSREVELAEGMVFTNEPGLYIEEEGIGIRIEDDLLVTENGCENLSKHIIKSVEDIEEFMSRNQ